MASGTAALAAKLVSKKSNNKTSTNNKKTSSAKKSTAAKKHSPKSAATRMITPRIEHPWKKIKEMYESGKSKDETAKACKIKVTSMNGIMDRLVRGVEVDGKVIRIVRGKKSSK